jgi:PII-like signaling protein
MGRSHHAALFVACGDLPILLEIVDGTALRDTIHRL